MDGEKKKHYFPFGIFKHLFSCACDLLVSFRCFRVGKTTAFRHCHPTIPTTSASRRASSSFCFTFNRSWFWGENPCRWWQWVVDCLLQGRVLKVQKKWLMIESYWIYTICVDDWIESILILWRWWCSVSIFSWIDFRRICTDLRQIVDRNVVTLSNVWGFHP